jgi:hypothetical protein
MGFKSAFKGLKFLFSVFLLSDNFSPKIVIFKLVQCIGHRCPDRPTTNNTAFHQRSNLMYSAEYLVSITNQEHSF